MSINTREGKCINLILIPECNYIKPGSQVNENINNNFLPVITISS